MKKTYGFFRPGLPLQLNGGDVKYAYEAEHLLEILVTRFPEIDFIVFSEANRDLSVDSRVWYIASENLFFFDKGFSKLTGFANVLDGCIFMPSPNRHLKVDGDEISDEYQMQVDRYEDLIKSLLSQKKAVIQVSTDPRWHWETIPGLSEIQTLGQMNYEVELSSGLSRKIFYSGVEHLSTSMWPSPINDFKRHKVPMIVISNTTPIDRYFEIKDYILDQFNDVPVYGKIMEGKSHYLLKGRLPYDKAWKELSTAKVTFISPIKRDWVTSKYLECLYRGVLPILSPSYDSGRILRRLPEDIRAKNPSDFKKKVEFWVSHDSLREELVMYLQSMYFDKYFQEGYFISDKLKGIL